MNKQRSRWNLFSQQARNERTHCWQQAFGRFLQSSRRSRQTLTGCHRLALLEPLESRRLLAVGLVTKLDENVAALVAAGLDSSDGFGSSVTLDGDTLAVGAAGDDTGGAGSVYLFDRDTCGNDNWGLVTKLDENVPTLAAAGLDDFDQFGTSVTLAGDTLAVGAFFDETNDAGSVYLFDLASPNPSIDFDGPSFMAAEGDATNTSNVVMLTRTGDLSGMSSVDVELAGVSAIAGTDFTAGPVTVTFNPTEDTKAVPIELLGETIVELNETILLSLTNFSNAAAGITQTTSMFTIENDDDATVSINDVIQDEGSGGGVTTFTFTVTLSARVDAQVKVDFDTANGDTGGSDSAVAPHDFADTSGTLMFPANSPAGTTMTIDVDVAADDNLELDELFLVELDNLVNNGRSVTLTDGRGEGTIQNDDNDIILSGTAGDDDLVIIASARDDGTYQLFTGGVPNPQTPSPVPFNNVNSVLFDGRDGDDLLELDMSGISADVFAVAGGIEFNGGTQIDNNSLGLPGDAIQVSGGKTADTIIHRFDPAGDPAEGFDGEIQIEIVALSLTSTDPFITYTGLEPVLDNMNTVDRVFEFTAGMEDMTLSWPGDMGLDNKIESTLGESVSFDNPTGSLTINTTVGSGADKIFIEGVDGDFDAKLEIIADSDDSVAFQTADTNIDSGDLEITAGSVLFDDGAFVTTGDATINADSGSIDHTGGNFVDLTSTNVVLTAADAVGASGPGNWLDLAVDNLEGTAGAGGFFVWNIGDLEVGNVPTALGLATTGVSTSGGDIEIYVLVGDLTVSETIDSGGGNIELETGIPTPIGGDINIDARVLSDGGTVTAEAENDIYFASTGLIDVESVVPLVTLLADQDNAGGGGISMTDGSLVNARGGDIDVDATDNILLAALNTTADVTVDSTNGSILDNGDSHREIEAATAVLTAFGAVGAFNNPLETQLANLEGDAAGGGFFVGNIGNLLIGGIGPVIGISSTDTVVVRNAGGIEVGENATATVDIELVSLSLVSAQPIVVNRGVDVSAGFDVRIHSSDDVDLKDSSDVLAGNKIEIKGDFDDGANPDVFGATINLFGTLDAAGTSGGSIVVEGGPDDDFINVNPGSSHTADGMDIEGQAGDDTYHIWNGRLNGGSSAVKVFEAGPAMANDDVVIIEGTNEVSPAGETFNVDGQLGGTVENTTYGETVSYPEGVERLIVRGNDGNETFTGSAGADVGVEPSRSTIITIDGGAPGFGDPHTPGGTPDGDGDLLIFDSLENVFRVIGETIFTDGNGDFIVMQPGDFKGVNFQQIESLPLISAAPEFPVNDSTSGFQVTYAETRNVAANATGDLMIAFAGSGPGDTQGIFARRFDPFNTPLGTAFLVNDFTSGNQRFPSVALGAGGESVVAWSGRGVGDNDGGVYARLFDSNGTAVSGDIQVSQTVASDQHKPVVAKAPDGSFLITWSGKGGGDFDSGVFARRYAANGDPLTGEFLVNTTTSLYQKEPDVAIAGDGSSVIVWSGNGPGDPSGVFFQRYDTSGLPVGPETRVNTTVNGGQKLPSVAIDGANHFTIVWSGRGNGDSSGVFLQRYNASGTPVGGEELVNTTTLYDQEDASISMPPSGAAVVTWTSLYQDGGQRGVYAQEYGAAGAKVGGEVQVHDTTDGTQQFSSVAARGETAYTVVWSGKGAGDTTGVFAATRLRAPLPLLAAGGQAMGGADAGSLTQTDLDAVVAAAVQRFDNAGLSQTHLDLLFSIDVRVADLSGARLGETSGSTISIDVNAAGYGWFVDATPLDDEEFWTVSEHELSANAGNEADGKMDLLTAVMHEMGHVLGLHHAEVGTLMGATLGLGTRHSLDELFAELGAMP